MTLAVPKDRSQVERMGAPDAKVKVMHVITGLETGGAEMMLYNLISHLDRALFETEVVSLTFASGASVRLRSTQTCSSWCRMAPRPNRTGRRGRQDVGGSDG